MATLRSQRKSGVALALLLLAGGMGVWLWLARRTPNTAHPPITPHAGGAGGPNLVYSPNGFGGYVPKESVERKALGVEKTPLQAAQDAYNAGRYQEAEAAARRVVLSKERERGRGGEGETHSPLTTHHSLPRQRAQARLILAYAAARQNHFSLARERFAVLQREAAALPDHGKPAPKPGENAPTLEEEAAYQHAVLTAMGDRKAGEAEYLAFMRRYPESPLVHAAVRRIARMHGGDFPKEAEAVWKQAMQIQRKRQQAEERERSMCGPLCLAELLRRRGEKADAHALAREVGTNEEGTSLKALAEACRKRGFRPRGLALTQKGLRQQKLPAIALLAPGHYVVIEAVREKEIVVWDPLGDGRGKAGPRRFTPPQWDAVWKGVTLTLR